MSTPIPMPDLGTEPARLSLWHVQPGEHVYAGDRVVEVVIPGAVVDVSAPVTGTVRDRVALPNDRVRAGDCLGRIDPDPDE